MVESWLNSYCDREERDREYQERLCPDCQDDLLEDNGEEIFCPYCSYIIKKSSLEKESFEDWILGIPF